MDGVSVNAAADDDSEAVRKARWEKRWKAVDLAATMLAAAIDEIPDPVQNRAMRGAVADICNEAGLNDPYDELDDQPDHDAILRAIRDELKRGDLEHALLRIHYELGDY